MKGQQFFEQALDEAEDALDEMAAEEDILFESDQQAHIEKQMIASMERRRQRDRRSRRRQEKPTLTKFRGE